MRVKGSIGFAILPGFTTIETAKKRTCFYGCINTAGEEWIKCHPTDVTRIWARWKTPGWSRGYLTQCCELTPCCSTIGRTENGTRFCSCIDDALSIGTF